MVARAKTVARRRQAGTPVPLISGAPRTLRRRKAPPKSCFVLVPGEAASDEVFSDYLEAGLHGRIVLIEFARQAAVFQHQAVRIFEINRLGPVVVDDFSYVDPLGSQLGALLLKARFTASLEGKMIESGRHAQPA